MIDKQKKSLTLNVALRDKNGCFAQIIFYNSVTLCLLTSYIYYIPLCIGVLLIYSSPSASVSLCKSNAVSVFSGVDNFNSLCTHACSHRDDCSDMSGW